MKNILEHPADFSSVLDLSIEINNLLKEQIPDYSSVNQELIVIFKNTGATLQETKKFENKLKLKSKRDSKKYYNIGLNIVFDIITAWLEDIISIKLGTEKNLLNNSENFDFIKENLLTLNIEVNSLLNLISDITKSRNYLKYSVNSELLLDNIFLSVKNLIQSGKYEDLKIKK